MALTENKVHLMDCLKGLRQLEDNSVDLIITDPPYNIAHSRKLTKVGNNIVSTKNAWGQWDTYHPFDYDLLIMTVLSESFRVLKEGGAFYMFTANEDLGYFIRKATQRGFTLRNTLSLVKVNPLPSFGKKNWRHGFELCMYLTKGKPKTFNFVSQQECINYYNHTLGRKHTKHPTEKPLPFLLRLVEVNSNEGDLVLDPFMGSGTTAVAAKKLGRKYIGFETNPEYIQMIHGRLECTERIHKSM
jgi:site-specific DNA-methyltransferase (adenine-specific)